MAERTEQAVVAPWVRVAILVGALATACAISLYSTGTVIPTSAPEALIFQSTLLFVVLGSAVLEHLQRIGSTLPVLVIGVPDAFVEHGSREDNLAAAGLDAPGLRVAVERFWRGQGIARAVPAG